jgi:hypothetical protein
MFGQRHGAKAGACLQAEVPSTLRSISSTPSSGSKIEGLGIQAGPMLLVASAGGETVDLTGEAMPSTWRAGQQLKIKSLLADPASMWWSGVWRRGARDTGFDRGWRGVRCALPAGVPGLRRGDIATLTCSTFVL